MLTGPPRINGVLLPYGQYGAGSGRMEWQADHDYFQGRTGLKLRQKRYYGVMEFGWDVLAEDDYRKVVAALDLETPVRVVPATAAPGDPADVTETELLCQLESDVPTYGVHDVAGGHHSLSVRLRTLSWVEERPGVSEEALDHHFRLPEGTDILGGIISTSDSSTGATIWRARLPVPAGRVLRFVPEADGTAEVRFFREGGAYITATFPTAVEGVPAYFSTPEGTYFIEVELAASDAPRPRLTAGESTSLLTVTAEDETSVTLAAVGEAYFEEVSYSYTTVMGNDVTLTDYILKPDEQASTWVAGEDDYSTRLRVDESA